MNKILVLSLFTLLSYVSSFNLDYEYTVVKKGPKDSLFGFSVTEHIYLTENWILVGAPRANSSKPGDRNTGVVYKCDATKPTTSCDGEVPFEASLTPYLDGDGNRVDSKVDQWLGVSLKSGGANQHVVSCAHRYEVYHGGDYRLLIGQCFAVHNDLSGGAASYKPCSNLLVGSGTPSFENYGQCLYGIGMDVHEDSTENGFTGGAAGALWFTGLYFEYEEEKKRAPLSEKTSFRDSYFGYSVVRGKFSSKDRIETAIGGPRHKSYGKVLVYKQVYTDFNSSISQIIPTSDKSYTNSEIQLASGFGIAICAIDADGNGYDELVIGAPFHSLEKKNPDTGMVYIYQRTESDAAMVLQKKLLGKKSNSNFGYSVASAGDLNLDGYPDLIVGAPHENDGQGAVYIFQGTSEGVSEEVTQAVYAEKVESGLNPDPLSLKGFGRSLSGKLDLDRNGYSDVLVGSYISNQAVLLRSRPIIIPHSSLSFEPTEINTDDRKCDVGTGKLTVCLNLKFCHNITEPHSTKTERTIDIKYKLVADSGHRGQARIQFKDSNEHEVVVRSNATNICEDDIELHLVFNDDDNIAEYPDIKFAIYYDMVSEKPKKDSSAVVNLDKYPVLASVPGAGKIGHVFFSTLAFKRECDKCIPNLKVTSGASNYNLHLGSKSLKFNISIANIGVDPAYAVKLSIKVPPSLDLESITEKGKKKPPCIFLNGTCENIVPKLPSNKSLDFVIALDTNEFLIGSENNITITVSSVNNESLDTMGDNALEVTFDIKVRADLEMMARASTQQVGYKGEIAGESVMKLWSDPGKIVEHTFHVRNHGPDLLPMANLTINWPLETVSGKHLLYLVDIITSESFTCDNPQLNILGLKRFAPSADKSPTPLPATTTTSESSRRRREVTVVSDGGGDNITTTASPETTVNPVGETGDNPAKDKSRIIGKALNCVTAKCQVITCTIRNLPSGSDVSVTVQSILWEPSLLIDYKGEVLTVISNAKVELGTNASYIVDPNLENNENVLYTVVNPEVLKDKSGIPIWIIALAVVAGVILLVLLIFGLHKLGFFKRNRVTAHSAKQKEHEKSLISK